MPARSKELAHGKVQLQWGFPEAAYTVPAGHVTIIKSVHFVNKSGGQSSCALEVVRSGVSHQVTALKVLANDAEFAADALWIVLEAGDTLNLTGYTAGGAGQHYWISGAELVV